MQQAAQRMRIGRALIVVVGLLFAGLIGRLVYLQTGMRPELLEWSRACQYRDVQLPGRRGAILDRRFRVLAGGQDRPTIYADPKLIPDHAESAERLAMVLGQPAADVRKALDKPTSPRYVVLAKAAGKAEVDAVNELDIPGVNVFNEPARTYPMGELAAQVVGFVSSDGRGIEGLELAWEKYLLARPGRYTVFCDAGRRALFPEPQSYVPPKHGLHLVLTLDTVIQEIAERELAKQVEHFKAESGIVLVMDPRSGEVLAMANYPTFNLLQAGQALRGAQRNRILTDPVEPGSIFKPFIMCAALAEKVTQPGELINCENGGFKIGSRRLHDAHAYSALTTEYVLIKSSNIGMAKLGLRLGNKKMHKQLAAFGFDRKTGIDLPGESAGLMMPLRNWRNYTTVSVPMGQELAVTPLQLATAFSAIVNGGKLLQPRVVQAVLDRYGRVLEDYRRPVVRGQAVDPPVAATVAQMMVKVVSPEGTGKACIMDKWQAMGKTGTALIPRSDRRGYESGAYLAGFIAAAPASDPALVVMVMIRKPNVGMGYYGGTVSAPAVKAILEQALAYLNVPPDKAPAENLRLAKAEAAND